MYFLLFGAALYWGMALRGAGAGDGDIITVSEEHRAQIVGRWERIAGRRPNLDELRGLERSWALEEAMVREARRLGLDRADPVIRRRLVQKMQALFDADAPPIEAPSDEVLSAWYSQRRARYSRSARLDFYQVFFAGPDAERRAATFLKTAVGVESVAGAGQPHPLGQRFKALTLKEVADRFGDAMRRAVREATIGDWYGPVKTAQGSHAILVNARSAAEVRPLSAVREEVLRDWRSARARERREQARARLLRSYGYRDRP